MFLCRWQQMLFVYFNNAFLDYKLHLKQGREKDEEEEAENKATRTRHMNALILRFSKLLFVLEMRNWDNSHMNFTCTLFSYAPLFSIEFFACGERFVCASCTQSGPCEDGKTSLHRKSAGKKYMCVFEVQSETNAHCFGNENIQNECARERMSSCHRIKTEILFENKFKWFDHTCGVFW